MKKSVKLKLTLSKETVATLEAGKLMEVAGGNPTVGVDGRLCYTANSCQVIY